MGDPLPEGDVRYETRSVRTVRGMESRSRGKWEKLGWEFVSQNQLPMLRTEMTFRRVKKKLPKYVLPLAIGVPVVAFAGLIILGVVASGGQGRISAEPVAAASSTPKATARPSTPKASALPSAPAATVAPTSAPTDSTASGLQWTWAWTTCEAYGKQQFPYGYDDSLGGLYAKKIQGDTWWLKYQATIANGYGAKQDVDVECTVGGSNDAPTVVSFTSY